MQEGTDSLLKNLDAPKLQAPQSVWVWLYNTFLLGYLKPEISYQLHNYAHDNILLQELVD